MQSSDANKTWVVSEMVSVTVKAGLFEIVNGRVSHSERERSRLHTQHEFLRANAHNKRVQDAREEAKRDWQRRRYAAYRATPIPGISDVFQPMVPLANSLPASTPQSTPQSTQQHNHLSYYNAAHTGAAGSHAAQQASQITQPQPQTYTHVTTQVFQSNKS